MLLTITKSNKLIDSDKPRLKQLLHHIGRFEHACHIVNCQFHFTIGFRGKDSRAHAILRNYVFNNHAWRNGIDKYAFRYAFVSIRASVDNHMASLDLRVYEDWPRFASILPKLFFRHPVFDALSFSRSIFGCATENIGHGPWRWK